MVLTARVEPVEQLGGGRALVWLHAAVLAESDEGGVHVAVSPDQIRIVYFQGHPEYDFNSLLKEYKREVMRFANGDLDEPPPFPEHYFPEAATDHARAMVEIAAGREDGVDLEHLERQLEAQLDNTWGDTAKAIFNNWLGLVYQLTNLDRHEQFMPGVDPDDPLGIRFERD